MTQTRDLIKKMADFFKGEEFYEKGEDARLELSPDDVRCMNEVIKACGNAISRQAVLNLINADWKYEGLEEDVSSLPPVTPQSKIGHWMYHPTNPEDAKCSKCLFSIDTTVVEDFDDYKYCPNCGAKMIEPQGSE